ncbi:hypothetical protein ACRW3B_26045, partial [Escherichia coli]
MSVKNTRRITATAGNGTSRREVFYYILIFIIGFAPIFPDICYHLTHYKPAAADIPVASDNPAH